MERATTDKLTIRYSKHQWRAEQTGKLLRMVCLPEHCAGIVFDITSRGRRDGHCDKDESYSEAVRRQPSIDRHGTNIMRVGRLAFVVTQSYEGEGLSARRAIFACMNRLGVQYNFASPLAGHPSGGWDAFGWLYMLALGFEIEPAHERRITIGEMDLTFDTDRWNETEWQVGSAAMLSCLPPLCDDWDSDVFVRQSPGVPTCSPPHPEPHDASYYLRESEVLGGENGTQRFSIYSYGNGCRNWTPPQVFACTAHKGSTYWISTPVVGGCRSYRSLPDEAFTDLLEGIRMRP